MAVSYKRLWIKLAEKEMSRADLIQEGQVIAQGQPPAKAVQRTDAAAEPAVG